MSNKHQAVILVLKYTAATTTADDILQSPALDQMINQGNSCLLVLRKQEGRNEDVQVFNSVTSISQLDSE